MSLNVESNRASGRTTRMILKAAEYLVKYPDKRVVIVIHDHRSTHCMKQYAESILNQQLAQRMDYISVERTIGIDTRKENYFFDHHCFYAKRQRLISELEFVNKLYGRWDE
ncbi:putative DNA binding protein [Acinetobacter phage vB_AbaP_EPab_B]|uniref:DNA binding protein n=1 Tax=Acinetobacter phage vB_AbaP_ZHSHW TaxID=2930334 RepID=A0AAE9HG67_9CAUD|nr:putative DNA binding protein [Acinetobacter phage vB_AbaP_ZHSHW]WGV35659.1 putative DNA binding protein [Acinetobacter phage vB_AbaP_EPab_B]